MAVQQGKGHRNWNNLFLFCLGIFFAAGFCMKWMESAFMFEGKQFTMIGMEVSYSKERLAAVLSGIDPAVQKILRYHLVFDFVFMAGVFPALAALCMKARYRLNPGGFRKLLLVLVCLQLFAWGCDITENCFLLAWMNNPVIGNEFTFYQVIVYMKWVIALGAVVIAVPLLIKRRSK